MNFVRPGSGLAVLVVALAALTLASADLSTAGVRTKVACWNHYFPFESEGPDFYGEPSQCLWYKRKADTYAEGALQGKRLEWDWTARRATAEGRLKLPGTGRDFGRGRVRLLDPVHSCGRSVFSRLSYRVRGDNRILTGGFPIYTCRSAQKFGPAGHAPPLSR